MNSNGAIPMEQLEAVFPPQLVKTRAGVFGSPLSYIEGHTVIGRLNDAFGGSWSFEIYKHEILTDEVLVLGKFSAPQAGVVKMAFGSSKITRDQPGNAVAMGDDLKAAATDALKKAATLLGVGLYLYSGDSRADSDDRPFEEELRRPQPQPTPPSGNGRGVGSSRVTNKQISAMFAIARQKGMPNDEVRSLCRQTFHRNVDYISKAEASQLIESLLAR